MLHEPNKWHVLLSDNCPQAANELAFFLDQAKFLSNVKGGTVKNPTMKGFVRGDTGDKLHIEMRHLQVSRYPRQGIYVF